MRNKLLKNNIVENTFILNINDTNIDKIYKHLKFIVKFCNNKYKMKLYFNNKEVKEQILLKNQLTNNKLVDIIEVVHAINIDNVEEKYNYIYDKICFKLDKKIETNYCEFKDNICIKYRNKNSNHENGCCECKGRGKCKYLINGVCTMKTCMACKLFTCHTLRKLGVKQNINDFILAKCFFNQKQKDILSFSYWTPKEEVMKKIFERMK